MHGCFNFHDVSRSHRNYFIFHSPRPYALLIVSPSPLYPLHLPLSTSQSNVRYDLAQQAPSPVHRLKLVIFHACIGHQHFLWVLSSSQTRRSSPLFGRLAYTSLALLFPNKEIDTRSHPPFGVVRANTRADCCGEKKRGRPGPVVEAAPSQDDKTTLVRTEPHYTIYIASPRRQTSSYGKNLFAAEASWTSATVTKTESR